MKRISALAILPLVLILFYASGASAGAQVRIRVIEASNIGSGVDPNLTGIHNQLGSLFNFNSYRLLRDVNLSLTGNRPVDLAAHPGRSLEVTLVGEYKNLIELRIRVKREGASILDTSVRLSSRRRVIFIGGPRHGEGALIFAISALF